MLWLLLAFKRDWPIVLRNCAAQPHQTWRVTVNSTGLDQAALRAIAQVSDLTNAKPQLPKLRARVRFSSPALRLLATMAPALRRLRQARLLLDHGRHVHATHARQAPLRPQDPSVMQGLARRLHARMVADGHPDLAHKSTYVFARPSARTAACPSALRRPSSSDGAPDTPSAEPIRKGARVQPDVGVRAPISFVVSTGDRSGAVRHRPCSYESPPDQTRGHRGGRLWTERGQLVLRRTPASCAYCCSILCSTFYRAVRVPSDGDQRRQTTTFTDRSRPAQRRSCGYRRRC